MPNPTAFLGKPVGREPPALRAAKKVLDRADEENLILTEANAIKAFCGYLTSNQTATREAIIDWLKARGWEYSDYLRWRDRITGHMASIGNEDPQAIKHRLAARLQHIAHGAESCRDFSAAVKATEAEARIQGIAIDAKAAAPAVTLNISNLSAPFVSDDDLLKIATAKQVDGEVVDNEPLHIDPNHLLE